MPSYDPTDKSQFTTFCLFIVSPEAVQTCISDRRWRNVNVCEEIYDWTLNNGNLYGARWMFSAATLRSWVWLLATIINQVELLVAVTKGAREKKLTEKEVEGMANMYGWCQPLSPYLYVH